VVLGAVIVAAAAAVAVVLSGGGTEKPSRAAVVQSPRATGLQRIPVGRRPVDIAAADGAIWVANSGSGSVTRISAARNGAPQADTVPALNSPFGVAAGGGFVWVAGAGGDIVALDGSSGAKAGTITRAEQTDGLALTADAIWTFNGTGGTVTRMGVDHGRGLPGTRTIQVGAGLSDIAAGEGAVWLTNAPAGTLVALDPASGAVARTIRLRGRVDSVAVGEGAVWVANSERGTLVRVDPADTTTVPVQIGKGTAGADVAVGDGAVFYIDEGTGEATRIDPDSGRPVGTPTVVAKSPTSAVVAGHALWVTDGENNTVTRMPFS
jgi:streptogramin lyase